MWGRRYSRSFQIKDVDLIGLAKAKTIGGLHSSRFRKTEEKIFHPQFKAPLGLEKHSTLLRFLDQIRDEAHRFAITYHKKLRGNETVRSELGDIPGIGQNAGERIAETFRQC